MRSASLLTLAGTAQAGAGTVYFQETFGEDWRNRWVDSELKRSDGTAGDWKHAAKGDHKGIQTGQDSRFFGISTKFDPFSNKGKDLVIQYQMKHTQNIDCGGGYIKVGPEPEDLTEFGDPTEYYIMFGPDQCGSTKRIHVILNYKGKNVLRTNDIPWTPTVGQTHLLTLVIKADQSYEVLVDDTSKATGSLIDDFEFLAPKEIKDPALSKPKDWVDEAMMDDPEDKKPEDWVVEERIVDPTAEQPEDWDEEEDGEWEAPIIDNSEFKGAWKARRIDNSDYQGPWEHPMIANPDFEEDDSIYAFDNIAFAGFDLWQVKGGTIFDNIFVTDTLENAKEFADTNWKPLVEAEKKAADEKLKEEAEKKASAKAAPTDEDEDDLDLDDLDLDDDDL